jgi:methyltransferase-like protein
MSIDQKIAQLLEDSEKLQAEMQEEETSEEVVSEEVATEDTEAKVEELKIDVSADVAALVNGEELTEEFKTKAATIFEAAVVTRVKAELAKLEEQFESRLDEQVEEIKNGLVEKVDGYLNYVVEQWMTDNEIALENGLKNDIMESFIVGMKDLFEQHYIDVPQEKYDLIGNMQEEIEGMKSKLDEQLAANVEMKSKLDDMVRKSAIEEVASEMVATDAEKFRGLAEELSFDELESFKSKLQTIKENYFGQKPAAATVDSVVTDSPVQQLDEDVKQIDPIMARYVSALKKS